MEMVGRKYCPPTDFAINMGKDGPEWKLTASGIDYEVVNPTSPPTWEMAHRNVGQP